MYFYTTLLAWKGTPFRHRTFLRVSVRTFMGRPGIFARKLLHAQANQKKTQKRAKSKEQRGKKAKNK